MTLIELPDSQLFDVTLEPHRRVVLGGAEESPPQAGRLAVSRPSVRPLTLDDVDDDAKEFLLGRDNSRFLLLSLKASFTRDEDKPFQSAWLDLTIRCEDVPDVDPPVAWSMQPNSESDTKSVVNTVTLSPSLKLEIPVVSAEVNPGYTRERQETFEQTMIKVEALREGTSTPRWIFYPTEVTAVGGSHRLCAVIEIPAGEPATAEISMGATIRLRRLKVFRYNAALSDVPDVAVVKFPAA